MGERIIPIRNEIRDRGKQGDFPNEHKWREEVDKIGRGIKYVKGARGSFQRYGSAFMEYWRSFKANIGTDRATEAYLYNFHSGLDLTEAARELAPKIRVERPDIAGYVERSIPTFFGAQLQSDEFPELKPFFHGRQSIMFYDLLLGLSQKYKGESGEMSLDDFNGLARFFSRQIEQEEHPQDFCSLNLSWYMGLSRRILTNFLERNIKTLPGYKRTKAAATLLSEFSTDYLNAIADPENDKHNSSLELMRAVLSKEPSQQREFISFMNIGVYIRGFNDKSADLIFWLQCLEENSVIEDDPIYWEIYEQVMYCLEDARIPQIYQSTQIEEFLSPLVGRRLYVNSDIGDQDLEVASVLLSNMTDNIAINTIYPIDAVVDLPEIWNESDIKIAARLNNGFLSGKIGFMTAGSNTASTRSIKFIFDISQERIYWDILDNDNIPFEISEMLEVFVAHGIWQYCVTTPVETSVVTDEEEKSVPSPRSLYFIPSRKKPISSQPVARRYDVLQVDDMEDVVADNNKDVVREAKIQRYKPLFILKEEDMERVLEPLDSPTRKRILRKLENQGSSRVKSYLNEVGPNGRRVYAMRLGWFRIQAEQATEGNTAIVFNIFKKGQGQF